MPVRDLDRLSLHIPPERKFCSLFRRLKAVSSTYILMDHYNLSLSLDATIIISEYGLTTGEHVRNRIGYHSNSMTCQKHP